MRRGVQSGQRGFPPRPESEGKALGREKKRSDPAVRGHQGRRRPYGITLPTYMFEFSPEGATKVTLLSFETNVEFPDYVFRKPQKLSDIGDDE